MTTPIEPIRAQARVPATFVREIDRAIADRVVSWWQSNGEHGPGSPVLRRAFTADEESALRRRAHELRCALEPLEITVKDKNLSTMIYAMLNGFEQTRKLGEAESLVTCIGLLTVVRSCPPWAIARAIEMIREGRAGLNSGWPPSEGQFRQIVDSLTEDYVERLARTEVLLAAPVEPEPTERPTREQIEAKLGRPLDSSRGIVPRGALTEEELAKIESDHKVSQQRAIDELKEQEP